MPTDPSNLATAGFEQTNRLLVLTTPLGSNRLLAETLTGDEQIGAGGFCLSLSALSDDAHIDLTSLIGQPVRLALQTSLSRDQPRLWHGHVSGARFEAANGGFARYRLRIEPWLAFLRGRHDSFAFQNKTVFDIVESVFADYQSQGKLAPAWRWQVADRTIYPARSLTTQFRETDFAFIERLLAEEGLFYWFEYASADGDTLGSHTMVIADNNGAFQPGAQAQISFQRADATQTADTVQSWCKQRRWQTNAVKLASWDYRGIDSRPVSAAAQTQPVPLPIDLTDDDYAGQYAYEDTAQGERLAHNALAARQVRDELCEGAGTARTLMPGTTFELQDHWLYPAGGDADAATFAVLSVRHTARNNFDESMTAAVNGALGAPMADQADQVDHYRNAFVALNIKTGYRPMTRDEYGARVLPHPTVIGAQTALVVGEDGAPVHTDRDHRIKVQFHWQRGGASSSRLPHPTDDNAFASATQGTWVRVADTIAGGDWGGNFVPRVGQEVLVQFMHGDIDRPIVVGVVYNGTGATDAQYNTTQSGAANATGNAPAWFAGDQSAYGHNAVMSGLKTQALSSSGTGTGGYNQLLFDDTPGQSRINVSTTQAESRLNLGHIKQQQDNQRLSDRGHGAELATQETLVVRAGQGLLIAADARSGGQGPLLDSSEATGQLQAATDQSQALAQSARAQHALLQGEPEPAALPAIKALKDSATVVGATQTGSATAIDGIAGGAGKVAAYGKPHLQISAPKGIAQFTPGHAFVVAGNTFSQVGADVNWVSGGDMVAGVANGLVLYAHGSKAPGQRPVQTQGIRLHAAAGGVSVQAQDNTLNIAAQNKVTFASTQAGVDIAAPTQILATAGGAYLKLAGGNIELHAPGTVELRASVHNWAGPQTVQASDPASAGELRGCELKSQGAAQGGAAFV